MTNTVFELENISFAYPQGEVALNNINFSIKSGESVALLGANGCGKSTLFRLLCGLIFAQSGKFSAFGSQVNKKNFDDDAFSKNFHRSIGFIFQNADAQLFCSNIRDDIAFGLMQLNTPLDIVEQHITDISQMLGISHLLDKPPYRLSGGEKKKAALAGVLCLNPDVLLLDEPTNELDPRTQRFLISLLNSLNRAGKTIILSTHNLELAEALCSRAILFDEDHKVAADKPVSTLLLDKKLLEKVNLI